MKCMRCGVEIGNGAVFCETCLADMEAHPVKQDAPVIIPRRENQQAPKRSKRRVRKPEVQISTLRRLVIWLLVVILVLMLMLAATVFMLLDQQEIERPSVLPGQNYGTSAVDG